MALSRVPYLVDRSALARMRHTAIAEVLAPLLEGGQVAVTAVLELEVLYSARNERDFRRHRPAHAVGRTPRRRDVTGELPSQRGLANR